MKTPHQAAMQGLGRKGQGQCDLCHGTASGVKPQRFPVGLGVHAVAGYKLCDGHAQLVGEIAADAGILWSGRGRATVGALEGPGPIGRALDA
ncbi:MAG: hypothetical protein Q8K55_06465 [Gemmatimonadaceae bacterium]|nr:hypothetical protein [Gemmatimonadaceae bacterium]